MTRELIEARWLFLWCMWRRELQLMGFRDPRWDYDEGHPRFARG